MCLHGRQRLGLKIKYSRHVCPNVLALPLLLPLPSLHNSERALVSSSSPILDVVPIPLGAEVDIRTIFERFCTSGWSCGAADEGR